MYDDREFKMMLFIIDTIYIIYIDIRDTLIYHNNKDVDKRYKKDRLVESIFYAITIVIASCLWRYFNNLSIYPYQIYISVLITILVGYTSLYDYIKHPILRAILHLLMIYDLTFLFTAFK